MIRARLRGYRAWCRKKGLTDCRRIMLAPGKSLVQVAPLRLRILSAPPLCPPSSVRFREAGAHREPCCTYGAYCTMRQVRPRAERSKNKSAVPAYGTPEFHHAESTSRLANSDLSPACSICPGWTGAFRYFRGSTINSTPPPFDLRSCHMSETMRQEGNTFSIRAGIPVRRDDRSCHVISS